MAPLADSLGSYRYPRQLWTAEVTNQCCYLGSYRHGGGPLSSLPRVDHRHLFRLTLEMSRFQRLRRPLPPTGRLKVICHAMFPFRGPLLILVVLLVKLEVSGGCLTFFKEKKRTLVS